MARATGGVTLRLTPASSIVGVAVVLPRIGWVRPSNRPSSRSRSRASTRAALRRGRLEISGLADDSAVDLPGDRDRLLHRGVPGLLTVAQDDHDAARGQ